MAVLRGGLTDTSGTPLGAAAANADDLPGLGAYTDSAGTFPIDRLPPGRASFTIRRLGYAPVRFVAQLPANGAANISLSMRPTAVQLATVVVNGRTRTTRLHDVGFYEREGRGLGVFFGTEFLRARRALRASALLREVPRVQLSCPRGSDCVPTLRVGASSRGAAQCVPDLWVDGVPSRVLEDGIDGVVDMRYIAGIEVYRSALEIPPRFARPFRNCGALVIWTTADRAGK